MKMIVLVDNNTYIDQYFLGEPALSIYIENVGKTFSANSIVKFLKNERGVMNR